MLRPAQATQWIEHAQGNTQFNTTGIEVLGRLDAARRFENGQRQIHHQRGTDIVAGAARCIDQKGHELGRHRSVWSANFTKKQPGR